ncbi:hypothetical protein BJI46_06350 [Acinetobacter qingfengensis]|uniref:HTH araC/xylS-type domain-containing protein n=2 Tax=Acinetobacter qingfengensis TaxID=1262585 RepID=A0A1E7QXM7_9GAMM|nr:hypothetical protein BJI46_06350 [Acinetobacter qingfengensis]
MLEQTLLYDVTGQPIPQSHNSSSQDWDEIKAWTDQVYMPYNVILLGKSPDPVSSMHSIKVGHMIVTRFKYGVPVHLNKWDQQAGNIILLTTLQGQGHHAVNAAHWHTTEVGESFLVDCSQTDDYAVSFHPDHLQLNLTIPHRCMTELMLANFGHHAPVKLWQFKTSFGGVHSSWLMLLQYLSKSIGEIPEIQLQARAGEHLQQMVCLHILNEWAARAQINLQQQEYIAPKYIDRAEQYMRDSICYSPTIAEIAKAVGVSIRTLSSGFKKYRQITPAQFMRDIRLAMVRQELLRASSGQTVAAIAYACGYINLGDFSRQYRLKYGERPSQTLQKKQ